MLYFVEAYIDGEFTKHNNNAGTVLASDFRCPGPPGAFTRP
jgi:hypothetical protein